MFRNLFCIKTKNGLRHKEMLVLIDLEVVVEEVVVAFTPVASFHNKLTAHNDVVMTLYD